MRNRTHIVWVAVLGCVIWLGGCKDEGSKGDPANDASEQDAGQAATVGPEGGTVALEGGASFEVPAGALDSEVSFNLTWQAAPEQLVPGLTTVTDVLVIKPSGTLFDPPAVLTLPYDAARVPEDDDPTTVAIYVASDDGDDWQLLETTLGDGVLTASVTHLSKFSGASGCRPNGNGCYSSADCCSKACWENKCAPCRSEGQTCESGFDCCGGLTCTEGKCVACHAKGGSCSYATDCCDSHATACVNGTCGDCLAEGVACDNFTNCCGGLKCVEGQCSSECAPDGGMCGSDSACCTHKSNGTVCKGGKCIPCDQPGDSCNLYTCCGKSICILGKCEACMQEEASCDADITCCSGMCTDGECRSCRTDGEECDGPADCCSGSCENNNCLTCPKKGGACGADADCCPGSCCDELGKLVCEDGKCSDCVRPGEKCGGFGNNCCGDMKCIDDTCQECRGVEGACGGDFDCCEGLKCQDGKCLQCVEEGSDCGAGAPCCSNKCIQGKCQNCLGHGAFCEGDGDCCWSECQNSKCVECAGMDEACDADKPCCEHTKCEGGKCVLACALPSQDCSAELPCCPGGICSQGKCYQCAEEGDSCDDAPCCPGFFCTNQNFCDKEEQGGDKCSCNTEGVTLTKVSGCDGWNDAEKCSGWASVVTESNGWEFNSDTHKDAMAFEVESGTEICAFDCCIKMTCP